MPGDAHLKVTTPRARRFGVSQHIVVPSESVKRMARARLAQLMGLVPDGGQRRMVRRGDGGRSGKRLQNHWAISGPFGGV